MERTEPPSIRAATSSGRAVRARPLQVALMVETSNAYARGLLEGVTAYLREHGHWSIYLSEHGRGDSVPHWLEGWRGDGILARIENRRIARAVAGCGLPTVDVSAAQLVPGIPWVETDDAAISRAAYGRDPSDFALHETSPTRTGRPRPPQPTYSRAIPRQCA